MLRVELDVRDRRFRRCFIRADLRLNFLNDLYMSHHSPACDDSPSIGVKWTRYLSGALTRVGEAHETKVRDGVCEGVVGKGEFLACHNSRLNVGIGGGLLPSDADHVLRDVYGVDLRLDPGFKDDVSHDAGAPSAIEDLGFRWHRVLDRDGGYGMICEFTGSCASSSFVHFYSLVELLGACELGSERHGGRADS